MPARMLPVSWASSVPYHAVPYHGFGDSVISYRQVVMATKKEIVILAVTFHFEGFTKYCSKER